jgi:hypothetical protein
MSDTLPADNAERHHDDHDHDENDQRVFQGDLSESHATKLPGIQRFQPPPYVSINVCSSLALGVDPAGGFDR